MDTLTRNVVNIGNSADAELAVREQENHSYSNPSPRYIGAGGSRRAFLINGIVYKVQHMTSYTSNMAEYSFWTEVLYRTVVPHHMRIRFLPVTMYEITGGVHGTEYVNAMPYIDGDDAGDDLTDDELNWLGNLGLFDMCADNLRYGNDGYIYVVDGEQ